SFRTASLRLLCVDCRPMSKRTELPFMAVVAIAAFAIASIHAQGPAPAPAAAVAPSGPVGTIEQITVHGKSLEGNLDGDSPDRSVIVYLPPGYTSDPQRRYPVVYLLHGYGLQVSGWMRLF